MNNPLALFVRLSILYAEDEESLRRSICQTLEIFFDKVIEAKDGEEALELFFEHKPDILLLDICMPKCDGLKLLKEIRKSHKRVPVIIMSAYPEPTYFQQSIELNICKYLLKPFSKESFLDAFKTCTEWMYEWGEGGLIRIGNDLFYDPISGMLLKEKEQFFLTKKERLLFEYFLRQKTECSHLKSLKRLFGQKRVVVKKRLNHL